MNFVRFNKRQNVNSLIRQFRQRIWVWNAEGVPLSTEENYVSRDDRTSQATNSTKLQNCPPSTTQNCLTVVLLEFATREEEEKTIGKSALPSFGEALKDLIFRENERAGATLCARQVCGCWFPPRDFYLRKEDFLPRQMQYLIRQWSIWKDGAEKLSPRIIVAQSGRRNTL